jgi:hypothetical protein
MSTSIERFIIQFFESKLLSFSKTKLDDLFVFEENMDFDDLFVFEENMDFDDLFVFEENMDF